MEKLNLALEWIKGPQAIILVAVLLGISEALASIPQVESNSIFQLVKNSLKWIKEKLVKKV